MPDKSQAAWLPCPCLPSGPSSWRSSYHLPLLVLAVSGFCAQVIQVSVLYFEYRTTTQVELDQHDLLVLHSIHLCIRHYDILDRKRLAAETGYHMPAIVDLDEAVAEESILTLDQIFRYTPSVEEVTSACFYRSSNLTFDVRQKGACASLFNVSKSFTQELVCYKFEPLMQLRLSTEAAVQSRYKQYSIYDLTLSRVMGLANHVVPFAFVGSFPYVSRRFSQSTLMMRAGAGDGTTGPQANNWINIFTSDFTIRKLPPPYQTACVDRPLDEYYTCKRDCLVRKFGKRFHKLPFTEYLEQPIHRKVIRTADLNNDTIRQEVRRMYEDCWRSCFFVACHSTFTKTTFRTILFKDFPFAFSAMTPTEADIVTTAQATMSFVEYFSFVSGCVSTWFGLHFLSLKRIADRGKRSRRVSSCCSGSGVPDAGGSEERQRQRRLPTETRRRITADLMAQAMARTRGRGADLRQGRPSILSSFAYECTRRDGGRGGRSLQVPQQSPLPPSRPQTPTPERSPPRDPLRS